MKFANWAPGFLCVVVAIAGGCASGGVPAGDSFGSAVWIKNTSIANLRVEPFEADASGRLWQPLGEYFHVMPGTTVTKTIGLPPASRAKSGSDARHVVLSIWAMGTEGGVFNKWMIPDTGEGFQIYAVTNDQGFVLLLKGSETGAVIAPLGN
ncbi:MAG: hypothetical protein U0573_03195 [Phycisphaerales bacterium]|nr:hypothetical protein [Planctomycetota bacterium]